MLGRAAFSFSAPTKPVHAVAGKKGRQEAGKTKDRRQKTGANAPNTDAIQNLPVVPAPPPIALTPLSSPSVAQVATPFPAPPIKASCAVLMDAESGQILYAQNPDKSRPMASTTKIMTALLFVENVADDAIITASKLASETRESSMHLKKGEKITAHDLLRGILMRSANDGCVAAAEHVAGTETAFVEKMNTRAALLGATHTHFTNPHGLHDKNHYTSARDLAVIAREALRQFRINEVIRTEKCRIVRAKGNMDVTMRNHSHFLGHFPGADGVKTGWTRPAGHCYVGSATWNGWRLIAVVLNSPDYVKETGALMKHGFFHFTPYPVASPGESAGLCAVTGGDRDDVPTAVQEPLQVISARNTTPNITRTTQWLPVRAPVHAGQIVGTLLVSSDGQPVCSSPLVATQDVGLRIALVPPIIARKTTNRLWLIGTISALALVCLRYGKRTRKQFAALAKSARRRRRRLAKGLRNADRGW